MIDAFVNGLANLDIALFHATNGLCGRSLAVDHLASRFDSAQLKSLAFVSTFGALWFKRAQPLPRQRETLVLTLFATLFSVVLARSLANLLPFRQRPMFMPDIGYRPPLFQLDTYLENWSSFPSDTAAVIFAMTTGFWLLSRRWGLLWVLFSILATLARVYFGLHYVSDVFVGALVGIGVTVAINREFFHVRIASPIVVMEQRAPAFFYAVLFPCLYEVSNLFSFTRSIYHSVLHLLGWHNSG